MDNAELHYCRADICDESGTPVARLCPLGWTCIGAPDVAEVRTHVTRTLFSWDSIKCESSSVCYDVDQSLRRFWKIDTCGSESHESKVYTEEENEAPMRIKKSVSYDDTTNRYTVGVPWKANRRKVPDNRQQAVSCLCSTERKISKDEFI